MNEADTPLVTAVVIHYENGDTIFETIDSVLMQDYPNIELIVSDDCSKTFDLDAVRDYIEHRKGSNIRRLVVRKNAKNIGTVAHAELVRSQSSGEIELLIAADDCWYDPTVFSSFVKKFVELGPDAEFITSQIEMCDSSLSEVTSYFISPGTEQMLVNGDMPSLMNLVATKCVLPGPGSAFRRSYFDKIGKLSNDYSLVEDWPAHLRWLRMGEKIYYLDKVTLKHRQGGISHSISIDWPDHYLSYREDLKNVFEVEVEPYEELFTPGAFSKASQLNNFYRAVCCNLRHRISVLILLPEDKSIAQQTLDSVTKQNCANFEMIIGCKRDQAEWIINHLNSFYVCSRSLRRVLIIPYEKAAMAKSFSRLARESSEGHCYELAPNEALSNPSALLDAIFRKVEGGRLCGDLAPRKISIQGSSKNRNKLKNIKKKAGKFARSFSKLSKIREDLLLLVLTLYGASLVELTSLQLPGLFDVVVALILAAEVIVLLARFCLMLAVKLKG